VQTSRTSTRSAPLHAIEISDAQANKHTATRPGARNHGLTRQGIYQIVQGHARTAGLTEQITPRTIRHACATHLLASGVDLQTLQTMLGHTDIATTELYTEMPAAA
jgi:site-specific recombinase XerD